MRIDPASGHRPRNPPCGNFHGPPKPTHLISLIATDPTVQSQCHGSGIANANSMMLHRKLQSGCLQSGGLQSGGLQSGGLQWSKQPILGLANHSLDWGLQSGGLQSGGLQSGSLQSGSLQSRATRLGSRYVLTGWGPTVWNLQSGGLQSRATRL